MEAQNQTPPADGEIPLAHDGVNYAARSASTTVS